MSSPRSWTAADAPLVTVLSVGEELLAGDIRDGNAYWLAGELAGRGHRLVSLATIGDDVLAIARAIERACEDAGLVLVSGGLGPTADDLTRDGVAAAFGLPLAERPELLAELERRALRTGQRLTPGARLQAVMPEGAIVLANPRGTAPGFLVRAGGAGSPGPAGGAGNPGRAGGTVSPGAARGNGSPGELAPWRSDERLVACFPGVPSEFAPMVTALLDSVAPRGAGQPARRLRACGLTESEAGHRLADLMDPARAGCRVGITATLGALTITVRGEDGAATERACAAARERLGPAVYAEGERTLAETVVALLAGRGLVVTCAESFTGGLLAGVLTDVPGSSEVFREAVVTYANAAKVERLGVAASDLAEHGAVSEVVVRAMAEGARRRTGADLALATTGVAGPGGGTEARPVGTVWVAVADDRETVVRHVAWKGSRHEIRARAVTITLELLRRRLLDLPH